MPYGSKYIESVEIDGIDKAKTEIVLNIKNVKYEENGFRLFINIHKDYMTMLKLFLEKKGPFKVQTTRKYAYK